VAPPGSGDDGGSLQWTSGSKRMTGSFIVGSSTFSQPPIVAGSGNFACAWWWRVSRVPQLAGKNSGSTCDYL
jgi:hypothetical protein